MQLKDAPPPQKTPLYLIREAVDPSGDDPAFLQIGVRVNRATEIELHRIATSERVVFWGTAAALLFDYIAHHNPYLDLSAPLPDYMAKPGGNRRVPGLNKSFKINVPLSYAAQDWFHAKTPANKLLPTESEIARYAAAILHGNAPRLAALVCAARHWAKLESVQ